MLPSAHVLVEIAARTAVIYGVVLIGVGIRGKREVGQMTPFDLNLLLLISNAVQNAMTGPDTSLIGGVIAATTLLILNYVVAELFFFFQAEDGIRDGHVTGVQTCALPI